MSDTPRTDELDFNLPGNDCALGYASMRSHARQLERELIVAKKRQHQSDLNYDALERVNVKLTAAQRCPEGWVCVPEEPTLEMANAGAKKFEEGGLPALSCDAAETYKAMIQVINSDAEHIGMLQHHLSLATDSIEQRRLAVVDLAWILRNFRHMINGAIKLARLDGHPAYSDCPKHLCELLQASPQPKEAQDD